MAVKFVNVFNKPKAEGVVFEGKTRVTGVGYVTLGQRIRGLLTNNRLDLSGVKTVDDYDDNPKNEEWSTEKDVDYDETQDFLDKIDLADKEASIVSKLEESVETQISDLKAKTKTSKEVDVSSVDELPPEATTKP